MSAHEMVLLVFKVVGGLSLFIYGMHAMTCSLRAAAGNSLRTILAKATRSRLHGAAFGVAAGFLAHSGASIAMLAGFVDAGVMGLGAAMAPTFGANVGTSLSMQLVSFHVASYCWAAIGVGFLVKSLVPSERWGKVGEALMGFGLLFLGMDTISAGIAPHKDALAPFLSHVRGDTLGWRLAGVGISALLTALLTSSGAMIGLCFALVKAGVFTRFDQVAVVVLGAHVGTCIVPLLAALPMRIGGRRVAVAHLTFNVLNVALALALWDGFARACEASAPGNLLRQAANLHTFAMAAAAVLLLPVAGFYRRALVALTPSADPEPTPSFLEEKLLAKPEQALAAVIRELGRMGEICVDSMMINGELILAPTRRAQRRLHANEDVLNEVRRSMDDYLERLTKRYLSRRQMLFLQHLDRCAKDIERIGDHLEHIGETSVERFKVADALLPEDLFRTWFTLFCSAKHVVALMARSFDPDNRSFQATALEILRARDAYAIQSMDAKAEFSGAAREKRITPAGGYYLGRYVEDLDRLVRRAKSIALAERNPDFRVKPAKLEKDARDAMDYVVPALVDAREYLELLRREAPYEDVEWNDNEAESVPEQSPHRAPPDETDPA